MNRNLIIGALIFAGLLVIGLGGFLVYTLATRSNANQLSAVEQVNARKSIARDPYAGREQDAINIVRNYKVLKPEYIDGLMESKKSGKPLEVEFGLVTIDSLVEQQFLEKRFNMEFLTKGEWRALHLDTDLGGTTQTPESQYEVYLDYHDEAVVVAPVWIVDLETGEVIPRNDMASVFDRNSFNYDEVEENLKRPAYVVRAITSHKFDTGIDLGGVFLLYFLKLTSEQKHADDQIIGWTVIHEFKDEFSAYFQWKEMNENRVAKFRFNWATKSLEPKGLLAIDLMRIGENMDPVTAVDIYPNDYTNDLHIPRTERWVKGHGCRNKENHELCTAFVKVLEQQEFISAMAWLLTNGEPNATRRVEQCKTDRKCFWWPRKASPEHNPQDRDDLIEISYTYEMNKREQSVSFLVDSKTETVTPLDKLSQWAYWSVTPRT
jgi:hypothetical protein